MRLFLLCLWCCFYSAFAKAQSPPASPQVTSLLKSERFYGVDDFNHMYYSSNNVLYKKEMGPGLNKTSQDFYDIQLGALTSVDIINPLKLLLFYKDTQIVVLLDNRLNESQRIRLSDLKPYRFFEFIALAGERRFWMYNIDLQRLELYDYINDKLVVSSPVIEENVDQMLSDYNYCHLVTQTGVASYNNYGSRTSLLPLEGIQLADFDFKELVVLKDDALETYKFNAEYKFETTAIQWEMTGEEPPQSLYLKNGKLYLYRRDSQTVVETNQKQN